MPLNAVFKPSGKLSTLYAYPASNKKIVPQIACIRFVYPPPPVPPEGGSNQMAASLNGVLSWGSFSFR